MFSKKAKTIIAMLLVMLLALSVVACGKKDKPEKGDVTPEATPGQTTKEPAPTRAPHNEPTKAPGMNPITTPAAAPEGFLTGRTAFEVVADMGLGWNLGNTFDATSENKDVMQFEQGWGNPIVTKELIDAVAAAGFNSIRIPTTWYRAFGDKDNYVIREDYLTRVKEVVDYAYANNMYVILNVHHENWVNDKELDKNYEKIGNELYIVWEQISTFFADYDQHLIFEGMNEPRKAGASNEWNGDEASYKAVQYLNSCFANAVKNGLGNNDERCLMIPGYAASNSQNILNSITVPVVNGKAASNVIASIHCYSPYDFCLSDKKSTFNPDDPADTSDIDRTFNAVKEIFIDNGIPAVIGETSATNTKGNTEEREKWAAYMGKKSAEYGTPIVIWDNGNNSSSGGECHAWFDRAGAKTNYTSVIEAVVKAYKGTEIGSGLSTGAPSASSSSYVDGADVIYENKDGLVADAAWNAGYFTVGAKPEFFRADGEIIVAGKGKFDLILDSEAAQVWWIQIAPTSVEEKNGVSLYHFSYADCIKVMKENKVDAPSMLRNFMIVAETVGDTMYEIAVTGSNSTKNFVAMGVTYGSGDKAPEKDPSYTNMKFDGWYTTKTYDEGTEYTGSEECGANVYAKFELDVEKVKSK